MATKASAIRFHVEVPVSVDREGPIYVASCGPLDVVSQGETEAEALENLSEAVRLFIETAYSMGTLQEVLTDCGFRPDRAAREPDERMIDVPLPLLVARKDAEARPR
jgi:predicted RNase H-like HicB family nuclease